MRTVFGSTTCRLARHLFIILPALFMFALAQPALANSKYAGIVIDAKTGKVLYSNSADSRRYPASLTKMMTVYMLFEAIDQGKLSKKTRIKMSRNGASMQPSKLGLRPGQTFTVEQAILALVTKSANDVAAAVGDHLGGSETRFAQMMTRKARALGMKRTTFRNASGLPNSKQVTTARDMAMLGIALREHFPHHYHYFSTRSFKYGKNRYSNHNRLLGQVRGVDGIKTGYTRASGYNLVSSVETNRRSIVAVVMGGRSGKSRNAQMVKLINAYLPKASRGRDRMLVAKAPSRNLFASLASKINKAPVPKPSPATLTMAKSSDDRVLVAHTAAMAYQPEATDGQWSRGARDQLARIGRARMPVPARNPVALRDPVVTAVVRPSAPITLAVTDTKPASAKPTQADKTKNPPKIPPKIPPQIPQGWQIQIGALPSEENAQAHLAKARARAPNLLASVANHTETVEKNGATLYRARFAGFASKGAAWDACAALKKKKFACLALAN